MNAYTIYYEVFTQLAQFGLVTEKNKEREKMSKSDKKKKNETTTFFLALPLEYFKYSAMNAADKVFSLFQLS